MKIEQKLKLSQNSDMIYFFRDGAFVRLFGVSLFLAITELQLPIKVTGHRYKKLCNVLILRAGYPESALKMRYPNLIKYDFGYGLKGDWQFSGQRFEQ